MAATERAAAQRRRRDWHEARETKRAERYARQYPIEKLHEAEAAAYVLVARLGRFEKYQALAGPLLNALWRNLCEEKEARKKRAGWPE